MDINHASIVDILQSVELVEQHLAGMTEEEFMRDDKTKDAVVRRIEIIGEATKRLRTEFRDRYPEVPWKGWAGMRDRVIHQYEGVDYSIVWVAATVEVAEYKARLEEIVKTEG